jgi:hypothetical protein
MVEVNTGILLGLIGGSDRDETEPLRGATASVPARRFALCEWLDSIPPACHAGMHSREFVKARPD